MTHDVEFLCKWRCFKKGQKIAFRKGANILVGDQGSGKSSLLYAITCDPSGLDGGDEFRKLSFDKGDRFRAFDSEKDNPRTKDPNLLPVSMFAVGIVSRFGSHGETLREIHLCMEDKEVTEPIIIVDEPESGLAIPTVLRLIKAWSKHFIKKDKQLLIATHHPYIIASVDEVIDMDKGGIWRSSQEYLRQFEKKHRTNLER